MREQNGDPAEGPLWAQGDMMFRVAGLGSEPDRMVKVRRPFALLGRAPGSDITIDDPAVSARHTYLHLDPRGVYAVDLVTRHGTRHNGTDRMVGWLRPGDWIEVAGRRIELLRIRIDGDVVEPPACDDDLLADRGDERLVPVVLEPRPATAPPWVLGSELVFLGWSASCAIPIQDVAVARTHCALIRSAAGAFLVDLYGRNLWVEDRPVRGASVLQDGDLLTLGSTRFHVRVTPLPGLAPASAVPPAQVLSRIRPGNNLARIEAPASDFLPGTFSPPPFPINLDLVPAEAQTALLGWMLGTIQGGQGEVLRRQGEFQLAMTQLLHQMQQDSATLLNAHLQRIESIDRELTALRAEIERRGHAPPPPPPPNVPPLRIPRPAQPTESPPESQTSTTWMLQRVNQLEDENRSAWKDLLGRISPPKRAN